MWQLTANFYQYIAMHHFYLQVIIQSLQSPLESTSPHTNIALLSWYIFPHIIIIKYLANWCQLSYFFTYCKLQQHVSLHVMTPFQSWKKKTVKNFYLAVYLYLSFHIFVQLSQQVSFLFLIMWHKNLQLSLIRCLSVLAPLKYFSIIILAGPRNFSTIFVTSHLWSLKRLF